MVAGNGSDTTAREAVLDAARKDTVQVHDADALSGIISALWFNARIRGGVVSDWPSNERDYDLRDFWRREGNDILAGAIGGYILRVTGYGWTLNGEDEPAINHFQDVLQYADLGGGWTTFLNKLAQDFLTTDKGAFMEIIGPPRDKTKPLARANGVAHLDSVRCWLTGDLDYPVAYFNQRGEWHVLHWTRCAHIVDTPSPWAEHRNWGFCSTSRVLAASEVLRELAQYKKQKLDSAPPAGILTLGNVSQQQWRDMIDSFRLENRSRGYDLYNGLIPLTAVDPTRPPTIEITEFANADWMDQESEVRTYVNLVALGFGVDPQDIWPLAGGNIGTGTQSEVLHQKSRGKGIRNFMRQVERIINLNILPDSLSFEFDASDIEEDQQRADRDSQIIANVEALSRLGLPQQNAFALLVERGVIDQEDLEPVEEYTVFDDESAVQEADPTGNVLPDDEDETETTEPVETEPGEMPEDDDEEEDGEETTKAGKVLARVRKFLADFQAMPIPATVNVVKLAFGPVSVRYLNTLLDLIDRAFSGQLGMLEFAAEMRVTVDEFFPQAYTAGLTDGGVPVSSMNDPEVSDADRQRLSFEIGREQEFTNKFVNELFVSLMNARASGDPQQVEDVRNRFTNRLVLWQDKLQGIYNLGVVSARGDQMMEWMLGPTEENCRSCVAAGGQVHRGSQWLEHGVMPQSKNLECGGWRCQCSLVPTDKAANGRLRTVPLYTPGGGFATAGGALASLFFRDRRGRNLRNR